MAYKKYQSWIPSLLLLTALGGGCGDEGSYELSWTIGCRDKGGSCELSSPRQCATVGVDMVLVEGGASSMVFPCYSSSAINTGRGPGLAAGPLTLKVSGLSPGGQEITGPVEVPVEIPVEGVVAASVDLPTPPQCHDGMDNDGDGVVDLRDPGCSGEDDTSELQ